MKETLETMDEKTSEVPESSNALTIEAKREGTELGYRVTNTSSQPIWAFLLVPTVEKGQRTFAKDAAWLESDGDVLLVRKVDTPVPNDVKSERIRSGAVQLAPGATREGRIELGNPEETRPPYGRPTPLTATKIVVEVGWLPVREGQPREELAWEGEPFAYLRPEVEPGGQRFARSAPIAR